MIAGPNGSGKSTFVRQVRNGKRTIAYSIPRIINPDEIAVELNAADPDAAALRAGREALAQRAAALAARESFGIETTFSGNSERQLLSSARAAGYAIAMTYVALNDAEKNVWRVTERTAIEGRTVPAEDVIRRYDRSLHNLTLVAEELDVLRVFDNSGRDFVHVLTMERGRITMLGEEIPAWVERALERPLAAFRGAENPG